MTTYAELEEAMHSIEINKNESKNSFMRLNFKYIEYIVPYEDGLVILDKLSKAEQLINNYPKLNTIIPITNNSITMSLLSTKEYIAIKAAQLLGITDTDFIEEYLKNDPKEHNIDT